jgi:dihydroorotase
MLLLIKKATLLWPGSKHHNRKRDVLIRDGRIEKIAASIIQPKAKQLVAPDLFISAGWCDVFADFCEPGNEQKETLASGIAVALAGGYTDIALIPNTQPITQHRAQVEFIRNAGNIVNLHPIGALSKNLEGKDLAEMHDMQMAGAVGFSDGKRSVQHAGLLVKALQYIKTFQGVIIDCPDEETLTKHGLMHEGPVSTQLGMAGKPSIAEALSIQQGITLAAYTQSHIHFTGVSTAEGIALIREAKKKKNPVTCSVNLHHILFSDEDLEHYDSVYKIHPPLRSKEHQLALQQALSQGVIDAIASHHFPQNWDAKQVEFEYAANGQIGLQLILPMLLKLKLFKHPEEWIHMVTEAPRRILGLKSPALEEQQPACLTVFTTSGKWMFNNHTNKSLSNNSPYFNQELTGKVLAVINNNQYYIHE